MFEIAIHRRNFTIFEPGLKVCFKPEVDRWLLHNAGPRIFTLDFTHRKNGWWIKAFREFHSFELTSAQHTSICFVNNCDAVLFKMVWL